MNKCIYTALQGLKAELPLKSHVIYKYNMIWLTIYVFIL